jgi:ribosomal protein S18 acetylase RimI-like enzyme
MRPFDETAPPRAIVGFHTDADGHWVAELACGHRQHVRHIPPMQTREWVLTAEGRQSHVGHPLLCMRCLEAASRFRRAGLSDVDQLVAMMQDFYADDGDPFDEHQAREAFTQLTANETLGAVLVAEVSGRLVAYVAVTLGFSMQFGGRDAFVDDLYVRPAHRGQGLGRAAVTAAEMECRSRHLRAIHLEVHRHNDRARTIYRNAGFAEHEHLLMTKTLIVSIP